MIKLNISKYAIATFTLPFIALSSIICVVYLKDNDADFAKLLYSSYLHSCLHFVYEMICWFSSAPLGIRAFAEMKEKKCKGKTLAVVGLILGVPLPIWLIVVLQLCGINIFSFAN